VTGGRSPRDCVSSVLFAGSMHQGSQPLHLKVADVSVCAARCAQENR
jgi:electron-transferring-flavoprotein dehydrogenase